MSSKFMSYINVTIHLKILIHFYRIIIFIISWTKHVYILIEKMYQGGAEHLARIHGTEEDKVNCPFYFKIGACRHGDRCSRQHHRPPFSQTLIVKHMWQNPMVKFG